MLYTFARMSSTLCGSKHSLPNYKQITEVIIIPHHISNDAFIIFDAMEICMHMYIDNQYIYFYMFHVINMKNQNAII
jgi:hypothetical protein